MSTAAIIVAAGSGQRFGDAGKSFAVLRGQPMAWWSLQAASAAASIDEIVLVCGAHSRDAATELIDGLATCKPVALVTGGARRQDSALAGIEATAKDTMVVAIHDAARPLVTSALFDAVVAAAIEHGAAIAAAPVSDTIKRVADGRVAETLPRADLVSVQTPQAFRKQLLLDAFDFARRNDISVTDEASLIEQMGGIVDVVRGSTSNIKVTYPDDLFVAEALMQRDRR
jgi:2-C-methyl-D-erythritol 4-phosphate cytidylyltransferase